MSTSGASKSPDNSAPQREEESVAVNGADKSVGLPTIRVILADTQAIYRVGTKKIFALEDDIRVVAQAENLGQVLAAAAKFPADVLLFEAAISPNSPEAISEVLKRASN